ncbi:hypothetical protein K503DRAFT_518057 [Rhizopogon vinicolor AM-OR11-026]|uniref:Uncharacterized protein n=1 Tax=Rhizopogon vinicolor AM-OR11-026 TaxID=1314800 RepID=A0A1B7MLS4_9AGAM|nr:hypothetical protein K503DRAFT_518057 [Rhizopogon vinicolor AM-OR11-026]
MIAADLLGVIHLAPPLAPIPLLPWNILLNGRWVIGFRVWFLSKYTIETLPNWVFRYEKHHRTEHLVDPQPVLGGTSENLHKSPMDLKSKNGDSLTDSRPLKHIETSEHFPPSRSLSNGSISTQHPLSHVSAISHSFSIRKTSRSFFVLCLPYQNCTRITRLWTSSPRTATHSLAVGLLNVSKSLNTFHHCHAHCPMAPSTLCTLFHTLAPFRTLFPSGKHHVPFLSFVFLTKIARAVTAVKDTKEVVRRREVSRRISIKK